MSNAPKLHIGDKVVVYLQRDEHPRVITAVVHKAGMVNGAWHYNYDTSEAFFYDDVRYVEKKGKWKRA